MPDIVKSSVGSCAIPLIVTVIWLTLYPASIVIVVFDPLPSSVFLFIPDDSRNVSFGNVIVLSAVGSVAVTVVSKLSAVLPSNTIELSDNARPETIGLVKVLFVNVSVVALPTNVSVAFGNDIVLSAVGSTVVRVVSKLSAVAPSNTKAF